MSHEEAEKRVKSLQKECLVWIEGHPTFADVPPQKFNKLRRKVFRNTFGAFRMGVVGIDNYEVEDIIFTFFGWVDKYRDDPDLEKGLYALRGFFFGVALESFRLGSIISVKK